MLRSDCPFALLAKNTVATACVLVSLSSGAFGAASAPIAQKAASGTEVGGPSNANTKVRSDLDKQKKKGAASAPAAASAAPTASGLKADKKR